MRPARYKGPVEMPAVPFISKEEDVLRSVAAELPRGLGGAGSGLPRGAQILFSACCRAVCGCPARVGPQALQLAAWPGSPLVRHLAPGR
jgi:hypothetical protein